MYSNGMVTTERFRSRNLVFVSSKWVMKPSEHVHPIWPHAFPAPVLYSGVDVYLYIYIYTGILQKAQRYWLNKYLTMKHQLNINIIFIYIYIYLSYCSGNVFLGKIKPWIIPINSNQIQNNGINSTAHGTTKQDLGENKSAKKGHAGRIPTANHKISGLLFQLILPCFVFQVLPTYSNLFTKSSTFKKKNDSMYHRNLITNQTKQKLGGKHGACTIYFDNYHKVQVYLHPQKLTYDNGKNNNLKMYLLLKSGDFPFPC